MKCKKLTITTLIIFLFTGYSAAQIDEYLYSESFTWSSWELISPDSIEKKVHFLDSASIGFDVPKLMNNHRYFRIIDINGDDDPDIIFDSFQLNGKTTFYLNREGVFNELFVTNEQIINVTRSKPWNPITFLTKNNYPSGNNDFLIKIYRHGFENGKLTFFQENSFIIRNDMTLNTENLPPMKFEILSVPELKSGPSTGTQSIQTYEVGKKGYAVASKRGDNMRTWWLVLIREEEDKYRVGWMLSKNLKRIINP